MTLRVGRLLCVGIRGSRPGEAVLERDLDACHEAGIGSVILFDVDVPAARSLQQEGLDPERAAERSPRNIIDADQLTGLIVHVRERLGEDVLICVDQEGGRVARLSPRRGFEVDPSAAEFGNLDPTERRRAALRQARRLRSLGFDLNFAPCVDLALDPQNQIIVRSGRSFGADADTVVEAAGAVLDAHAEAGVGTCLKHFPGHGSGRGDTHVGAVDITDTWQESVELEPYRRLSGRPGLAVMMAHVIHRGLDPQRPVSVSKWVVDGLLRGGIGFEGVVTTDSIDMRALSTRFTPPEAAVAAIEAGVDLVVDGFNLDPRPEHPALVLVGALRQAVESGRLSEARIEQSLQRLATLRSQIGCRG